MWAGDMSAEEDRAGAGPGGGHDESFTSFVGAHSSLQDDLFSPQPMKEKRQGMGCSTHLEDAAFSPHLDDAAFSPARPDRQPIGIGGSCAQAPVRGALDVRIAWRDAELFHASRREQRWLCALSILSWRSQVSQRGVRALRITRFMQRKRQSDCRMTLLTWWTSALLTLKVDGGDSGVVKTPDESTVDAGWQVFETPGHLPQGGQGLAMQVVALQQELAAAIKRSEVAEANCAQLALNECAHLEQLKTARRENSSANNSAAQAAAAAAQLQNDLLEKIAALEEENALISQRAELARFGGNETAASLQRRIRASEEAALESEKRLRAACQATEEVGKLLESEAQRRKEAEAEVLAMRNRDRERSSQLIEEYEEKLKKQRQRCEELVEEILLLKRRRAEVRDNQWEMARERERQRVAEWEQDLREKDSERDVLRNSLEKAEKELKLLRDERVGKRQEKSGEVETLPQDLAEAARDIAELVLLLSSNDRAAETAFLQEILVRIGNLVTLLLTYASCGL